jgi:hypothetical protein
MDSPSRLVTLPLAEWEDSRLYLQLVCQIVGKTRLALHPWLNHWWHVTLYVTSRGLTTGPIPTERGILEIDLDLLDHVVVIGTDRGDRREVRLAPRPIAVFYGEYMRALDELGWSCKILPKPYQCRSTIPFPEDREHATYDAAAVTRAWRVLTAIDAVLWEFRGRFIGKCSPVHLFWHSFDLAVTRFSGRAAADPPVQRVSHEAYSHEVCSAGFWFGDESLPEAAFYCYAWPAPAGLGARALSPLAAWVEAGDNLQARMLYEGWRKSPDPRAALLAFLESSYAAIADLADWDRAGLERSGASR